MVVNLLLGKKRFACLMDDIQPMVISQFIIWLDEKVAEFKVQGCMNLDMGTEAPKWVKDYSMSVLVSGTSILGQKDSPLVTSQDTVTPTHRSSESVNIAPSRTSTVRPKGSAISDKSKHIDNQNSRRFSQSTPMRRKRPTSSDEDDLIVVSVKREREDTYESNESTGAVMPYLTISSPQQQTQFSVSSSARVPSQITSPRQRTFTSIRKSASHHEASSPQTIPPPPSLSSASVNCDWPSADQSSDGDESCEPSEPHLEMSVVDVKEANVEDPVSTLDDTSHSQEWSYDEPPDLKPNTGTVELYSRMSQLDSSAVSAAGDDAVELFSGSLPLPIEHEPSTSGVRQSDEAHLLMSSPLSLALPLYNRQRYRGRRGRLLDTKSHMRLQELAHQSSSTVVPSFLSSNMPAAQALEGTSQQQHNFSPVINENIFKKYQRRVKLSERRQSDKQFDEYFKQRQRERKQKSRDRKRALSQARSILGRVVYPHSEEQQ